MSGEPHLEVRFKHRIGTLGLDVAFRAEAPWTVLFGASGSGKSTILRVIAGLETPATGFVRVERMVVLDRECGVRVAAHRRGVRFAAQRTMLFPRMTVEENLAFGADVPGEVARALEGFRLTELARKRPSELSGGESQRVAVARAAIGAKGRLLLLDEPFSGLDAGVRDGLIADLRSWLGDSPVVSVTHDVGEAFLLGAEVVRVDEGKVVAQGAVGEVLAEERRRLVGVLG
jgi:molybdate transport system ATP-binding protein